MTTNSTPTPRSSAPPPDLAFRVATPSDAQAIAALHADSWRSHYRGAFSDTFLDVDLTADRLAVWTQRLAHRQPETLTLLAEDDGGLAGFAHTIFNDDERWGALLDNLHVARRQMRRGVGSCLLSLTAHAVSVCKTGLYLWVLEQNAGARAFYAARGGTIVGRDVNEPPGGIASRLDGRPIKLRCAWPQEALSVLRQPGLGAIDRET